MKIKINKLSWNVFGVPQGSNELKINGDECFGVTDRQSLTIYLDRTLSKELYRQVVVHELIHAFTFSYGTHLFADESTEESICDFMGAHLDEIYKLTNRIMEGTI